MVLKVWPNLIRATLSHFKCMILFCGTSIPGIAMCACLATGWTSTPMIPWRVLLWPGKRWIPTKALSQMLETRWAIQLLLHAVSSELQGKAPCASRAQHLPITWSRLSLFFGDRGLQEQFFFWFGNYFLACGMTAEQHCSWSMELGLHSYIFWPHNLGEVGSSGDQAFL